MPVSDPNARRLERQTRLKTALRRLVDDHYDGVIARFAQALDVQADYASRMLYPPTKAGQKSIGGDMEDRITALHPRWLRQESEPYQPAADLPVATHRAEDSAGRADIHRIPKLNVAGGQGHGALLPSVEYQSSVIEVSDEWLRANLPGIRISNLRAITGLGPSMHPTFSDGDILFTDVSVTRLVHDRIFALFDKETGELFIKRVTRYPLEECWSITSDNPLHNNPPMADKVPLEKIAAKLGVGGCIVGKWAFTKL